MTRDEQTFLVEHNFAVCTMSLGQLREMLHARIAQGTFDEGDAVFLQGASRDVIENTHQLEVEAAMAEQPAPKDLH